eukprot:RCo034382
MRRPLPSPRTAPRLRRLPSLARRPPAPPPAALVAATPGVKLAAEATAAAVAAVVPAAGPPPLILRRVAPRTAREGPVRAPATTGKVAEEALAVMWAQAAEARAPTATARRVRHGLTPALLGPHRVLPRRFPRPLLSQSPRLLRPRAAWPNPSSSFPSLNRRFLRRQPSHLQNQRPGRKVIPSCWSRRRRAPSSRLRPRPNQPPPKHQRKSPFWRPPPRLRVRTLHPPPPTARLDRGFPRWLPRRSWPSCRSWPGTASPYWPRWPPRAVWPGWWRSTACDACFGCCTPTARTAPWLAPLWLCWCTSAVTASADES